MCEATTPAFRCTQVIFWTSPLRTISRPAVATAAVFLARKQLSQLPPSPMMLSSGNGGGRQRRWKQRQRRGHTTIDQQTAATWWQKRHSRWQQRQRLQHVFSIFNLLGLLIRIRRETTQGYIQKIFLVSAITRVYGMAPFFFVAPSIAPPFPLKSTSLHTLHQGFILR